MAAGCSWPPSRDTPAMRGFQELATVNRKMDVLLKDIIKNKAEVLKKINQEKKRQMQQAIKIQVKQQMKIEKAKMRRKQQQKIKKSS